jgi:hypothetical protein
LATQRCSLIGFGPTLEWPVARTIDVVDLDAAAIAAEKMLAEEPFCERVEIWAGGRRQRVIRRQPEQD